MATRTTYLAGGFDPNASAQNRAEQWSNGTQAGDPASGYTAWDAQGNVTTQRALNAAETAALTAQDTSLTQDGNRATLQARAQAALTANQAFINAAKPGTAATVASAAYDQAVTLSRECSALIRLLLGQFDTTSGT